MEINFSLAFFKETLKDIDYGKRSGNKDARSLQQLIKMAEYKLDRTAFKMHHSSETQNNFLFWQSQPLEERLKAANYLNSVAYNFPLNDPPKLDRTYFKIRRRK